MELSLTTFILEILNFLVLVWILKHFFFAPIKKTIEARRSEIKKSLDDAAETRGVAIKLQTQYENRLRDWEREKAAKFSELAKELEVERDRRIKEVGTAAAQERERLQVQEEKSRRELTAQQERDAISQSLAFLSKLLAGIASKEVEAAIVRTLLGSLKDGKQSLPADQPVMIRTAFDLTDTERKEILKGLGALDGRVSKFAVDSSLIAGVEVIAGPMVIRANLRDELKCFSTVGDDGL